MLSAMTLVLYPASLVPLFSVQRVFSASKFKEKVYISKHVAKTASTIKEMDIITETPAAYTVCNP